MAREWIYAYALNDGDEFLLEDDGFARHLTAVSVEADPEDEDFVIVTLDTEGENRLRLSTDERVYFPYTSAC
jgi:hypothetical protein